MKSTVLMVGESVVGKARTPKLWNLAFKQLGIANEVTELDYSFQHSSEIDGFLTEFSTLILGFPNKTIVAGLPTQQNLDSRLTGYNVVSWNPRLSQYQGYNFDGIAFCKSFKSKFSEVAEWPLEFVIIGTGSTAHSFLFEAKESLQVNNSVMISRNPNKIKSLNSLLYSVAHQNDLSFYREDETLKILINASPLGKLGYDVNDTMMNSLKDADFDLVFDFNYGERYQSPFSSLVVDANFLDGNEANVIQAALGFRETQTQLELTELEVIRFFKKLCREI